MNRMGTWISTTAFQPISSTSPAWMSTSARSVVSTLSFSRRGVPGV